MRFNLTLTFFLAILITTSIGSFAQTVRLRGGEVAFAKESPQAWAVNYRKANGKDAVQVLVKLSLVDNAETRASLASSGIMLIDNLGKGIYLALLTPDLKSDFTGIVSIALMPPSLKFTSGNLPTGKSLYKAAVSLLSKENYEALARWLKENGGVIASANYAAHELYEIELPGDKIQLLLTKSFVKTISQGANIQPLNLESQRATKTNLAHAPLAQGGYGLLGDSITIGVGDNSPGIFHIDLIDRIVNFNNAYVTFTNHGQHVNGTVGGAGILDPAGEGFAPHAKIVDHLYDNLLVRIGTMQHDYGMTVTNNSYAAIVGDCNAAGTYDVYAQYLDTVALQYPEVMNVFAAGNDGNITCSPYPAGFGTVVGQFQAAKNVLVVGNVNRTYGSYYNSSRGPMKDGRVKPEIVTTGSDVYSTGKFDTYFIAGATSFSSPQLAGASGLLQQRYKSLHGGTYPQSDLVKCLLLNGAMDIGNPGPDYTNGFGVLDAARSLVMIDSNHYYTNNIPSNTAQTATINVPANTGQIKVMLYWHDVPASAISATQLVNDLDLEVTEPNSTLHRPLILNSAPSQILNNAVEGRDSLNNVEQVVISTPVAGAYTIKVKSGALSGANQRYIVAYDVMQDAVQLTFPNKGAMVKAGDSLRIYWDASPGTQPFTVELSTNAGISWSTLGTATATQDFYDALAPNISSEACQVRVSRGSQQSITGNFVINPQPVLSLSAVQCPGYVNVQWTPVPSATAYQVWRKKGPFLQPEAIVTGTSFSIAGLRVDSLCYVAVQPLINGVPGYRSLGVKRLPNDGSCAGSFSDGDLAVRKIISPQTGRQGTSTALSPAENLVVLVANNDDAPASSYRISYRINSGAWQTTSFATSISPASAATLTIPGLDLSAAGSYTITAVVTNLSLADNVHSNDTLVRVVRQLANPVLNIAAGITDGFETSGAFSILHDSTGITANDRWDYFNSTDSGRISSFLSSDILISGNRSMSMDAILNLGNTNITNFLTGTFNASNYAAATSEVRFQFDYKLHGKPQALDSNAVWVRGADTQPWVLLYRYDTSVAPGVIKNSGTLSLSAALMAAGQEFSRSTQIRFGQRDTALIALNDYGNGLTLDNVRLYLVQNDVALASIVTPAGAACGMSATTPLIVSVKNGVAATQYDLEIDYQFDGGPIQRDTIATIAGGATVNYTFPQLLNTAAYGLHTISAWIVAGGDSYSQNDSILNYTFRNEPTISSFPYTENFEANDGYYFTGGMNSSWAYGTPSSPGVHAAASGTKAWKTNLAGNYNNNERSYLYSPCFDVTSMQRPTLAFNAVINVEDCDPVLCDAAWMEYSVDGGTNWAKLGTARQGINWYNDSVRNIWREQGDNTWRGALITLPSAPSLRLRWVLNSDAGTNFEGLAIDDVRVYDAPYEPGNSYTIYPNPVTDGTLHLQWTAANANVRAVLTDMAGKMIRDLSPSPQTNTLDIDLGGIARGVYILHTTIGDDKHTDKIVIR